jgi:two-component system, response regulator FlrC
MADLDIAPWEFASDSTASTLGAQWISVDVSGGGPAATTSGPRRPDMRLAGRSPDIRPAGRSPDIRPAGHALVVQDATMAAIVRRAEQVAWSEATVLITGESGTGKENLARHVHARSRRAGGPFVAVNCAAIPEQLLESELFGFERGAFSGAIGRRTGKFEMAHGGTILLDEISEMDVRLQAKLLRVLQEREIDRLGGRSPVRIDVRVIATTNRDLPLEVERRTFRQDLFFRLNVAPLRIPPLRERLRDVNALADYFGRKYAADNGLPPACFTAPAHARLRSHSWPGNVRELENIVHRAVIMCGGGTIGETELDCGPGHQPAGEAAAILSATTSGPFVARSLDQMERDLVLTTLEHTRGNRTHAAAIMGISIRALRNKLRAYAAAGIAVPAPASPGGH